jgi:hypothetical protein
MGIRWFFHKRYLHAIRLKREVTWEEAVIEYKSYWDDIKKHDGKMPKGILDLREYYKQLLKRVIHDAFFYFFYHGLYSFHKYSLCRF